LFVSSVCSNDLNETRLDTAIGFGPMVGNPIGTGRAAAADLPLIGGTPDESAPSYHLMQRAATLAAPLMLR
jgi:hypothetical protein